MIRLVISILASLIIPGLGQIIMKQYKRGVALIALWFVLMSVVSIIAITFLIIIHMIFVIATIVDVYRLAKELSTFP
jgi:hypothetical protein